MQQKLFHESGGQRTFTVVIETGEEEMGCLEAFAKQHRVSAAQISSIGAFSGMTLNYFDWEKKRDLSNKVEEQVEVTSLLGDVAGAPSGEPSIHIHLVVGRRDGLAWAGHLGTSNIRSTLELVITESPAHLQKVKDPERGLALIRPKK
jgi:predicted DNA-binding protein with PD1-like motif